MAGFNLFSHLRRKNGGLLDEGNLYGGKLVSKIPCSLLSPAPPPAVWENISKRLNPFPLDQRRPVMVHICILNE